MKNKRGSDGNFLPRNDLGYIARATATGYEIERRGGSARIFNNQGKLVAVRDRRGHARTINYDLNGFIASISDEDGREVLSFTTDENGHVTRVEDLYGRVFEYHYSPLGDLEEIVDLTKSPEGQTFKERVRRVKESGGSNLQRTF